MVLLAALYTAMPHMGRLTIVTMVYFIICTILGMIFPIVMGALTSLNASIRGTISSLANATMNGANTLGAWAAGLLYVEFGGYAAIGIFAAACLTLSLGMFLYGGVLERSPITKEAGRPQAS
jgi:predicted MFS family arabinose efflux permease